jgi:hypothetical protein
MPLGSLRKGNRKNGATGCPSTRLTALMPSSISFVACAVPSDLRLRCDQVCVPIVWPRRSVSRTRAGSATAMRPTTKKVARVHSPSSASRTGIV